MPDKILAPLSGEEINQLDELDLDALDRCALERLLRRVRLTYPVLAAREPEDDTGEEYLLWQENLETLDDYLDELSERL